MRDDRRPAKGRRIIIIQNPCSEHLAYLSIVPAASPVWSQDIVRTEEGPDQEQLPRTR